MASNGQGPRRARPGPWPPGPSNNSNQPLSWAKRTGFKGRLSGESNASSAPNSGQISLPRPHDANANVTPASRDLEAGRPTAANSLPPPPLTPPSANANANNGNGGNVSKERGIQPQVRNQRPNQQASRHHLPQVREDHDDDDLPERNSHINYRLSDSPGLVGIMVYGIQHYISMMGSLILIPLVIVPAMGGSNEDTAAVVSTVMFVTGVTTLLHTFFGTRLPLIQGPSFIYLAPVLALINSPEFQALNQNSFKHIMKELQGAFIISAVFQALMGYTGFMSLFLRLINPVVVSPTIAAVGLSFFSYGFTKVGSCIELGVLQILLLVLFSLYLRKIKLFGYRAFLIYAVPLGLAITWSLSFLLTETNVYSYRNCDPNTPPSNEISQFCRKHVERTKGCRADTSRALRSAPWVRFPYPFQWGTPVFNWKMGVVLCVASLVSTVDSVGSYHASSLFVATRPPTAGIVSRGIGIEGISTLFSALWGTGIGYSTLTENIHTIAVTKMGNPKPIQFGAIILILISFIGKIGGFIASIPDVLVGGLLCFMWAMLASIGFSNLRYSASGSSRNSFIVGLALFLSLSVPAYFQHYGIVNNGNLSVPSYFEPYVVASHGPIETRFKEVNYVLNILLSLNMVIAFLVAVILDCTVPGSRLERGVYVWSDLEREREMDELREYELPFKIGRFFRWVKWVGV
ncbi:hypothetical protein LUZ60_001779 [Juncus effusus]|nr:hypothetical protein LUZ60_001779 [Juncus effusus]